MRGRWAALAILCARHRAEEAANDASVGGGLLRNQFPGVPPPGGVATADAAGGLSFTTSGNDSGAAAGDAATATAAAAADATNGAAANGTAANGTGADELPALDPPPLNDTTAFEDLDAQAEILSPREGAELLGDHFEVGINVFTPDPDAFADIYPGCKVCLRLDGSPWACWAIFEMAHVPIPSRIWSLAFKRTTPNAAKIIKIGRRLLEFGPAGAVIRARASGFPRVGSGAHGPEITREKHAVAAVVVGHEAFFDVRAGTSRRSLRTASPSPYYTSRRVRMEFACVLAADAASNPTRQKVVESSPSPSRTRVHTGTVGGGRGGAGAGGGRDARDAEAGHRPAARAAEFAPELRGRVPARYPNVKGAFFRCEARVLLNISATMLANFEFTTSSAQVGFRVETDEPDKFEKLFSSGYVCFEVETAPAEHLAGAGSVPCWAVFANRRRPIFAGLGDGFRTLRGWLMHPDSKQLIEPTGARAARTLEARSAFCVRRAAVRGRGPRSP